MRQYHSRRTAWALALLVAAPVGIHRSAADDAVLGDGNRMPPAPSIEEPVAPPATPAKEQPEVLSRGPVHEAFAEPVNLQLQSNLVAPDRPPPGVEEVPPADRPQGGQFVWIPGYWAWDVG